MTWTMAGVALHGALFQEGSNTIILSRGEMEAGEVLDYVRFLHSQLPDFLKISKGHDQASLIDFPTMSSKVRALPATAKSGIGLGGATRIIADEFEFHEYAAENYVEIKPMIDSGGQLILLSAVDKYNLETKFKEIWHKAKKGENNFFPIFLPYDVLPERDEKWYAEQARDYEDYELEGRYPRTEQEAMSAPQLVSRFNTIALEAMRPEAPSPQVDEGTVKIYREGIVGRKYCLIIDPSEGGDPAYGMVGDWATMEKVAEFHGRISLDEQATIALRFYKDYHSPYTAIERNASGLTLIEKVKDEITTWHYTDKTMQKPGWWTSSSTRPVMIVDLAEAVRTRQLRGMTDADIDEFHEFIRTKKKPDGEARKGCHDDRVITWAMFLQIRKSMHVGGQTVISGRSKLTWR